MKATSSRTTALGRIHGVSAPGERTMAVYKNRRYGKRVSLAEGFQYHQPGFLFICTADFFRCHRPGTGDLPVEVISMSGTHGRNTPAGLCENSCPAGMGMDNTSYIRKSPVKFKMSRCIGRGFQISVQNIPIRSATTISLAVIPS